MVVYSSVWYILDSIITLKGSFMQCNAETGSELTVFCKMYIQQIAYLTDIYLYYRKANGLFSYCQVCFFICVLNVSLPVSSWFPQSNICSLTGVSELPPWYNCECVYAMQWTGIRSRVIPSQPTGSRIPCDPDHDEEVEHGLIVGWMDG